MNRAEPRLQRKLLAWLLGPLAALILVDSGIAYGNSLRFSRVVFDRALQEVGREIALHVRHESGAAHLDLSPSARQVLLGDRDDLLFFRLADAQGRVLGGDEGLPAAAVMAAGEKPRFDDVQVNGQAVRMVTAWIPLESAAGTHWVLVQVAETRHKRDRLAWEMVAHVMVPQFMLLIMATAVVWFGVERGLRPLQRLRLAVSNRSHRDLRPIETHDVPGEVRPLVDEVNDLFGRLERTIDFQNRFVADAAHQLKTPVSGLKAQIELALRETHLDRIRHSLAQLYLSADRLSRLVRQLLSLARNEPGALASLNLQPLDLNALALEVSMDWVPHALQRNIDLGFEGHGEQPLMIAADRDRLRELINNLIDNAIRYSQVGGSVTVRTVLLRNEADASCARASLTVSDDGPRIPEQERDRIFERFHRLLGSQTDGSGLGLAIVREIAALHGAQVTLAEDTDGVGNTFGVVFDLIVR